MKIIPVQKGRYADFTLQDLLRLRKPVKLTGLRLRKAAGILRQIARTALLEYELEGRNLSLAQGIRSGKFAGEVREIISRDSIYYLSGVLEDVRAIVPVPYDCDRFAFFKSRVWISARGTRTPLHRDIPHNLLLVVQGEKRVRLAKPAGGRAVYPHGVFSRTPNFARLNLFEPNSKKYPRSAGLKVFEAKLRKNDLLYIPASWWHDVESAQKTVSINFWFAPAGARAILARLAGFLNRLLSAWSRR